TLADYARSALDLEPRQARDLLRIGPRLPELHRLDAALASGALGWTKARELIKVLVPENEEAWVERAIGSTSRELERAAEPAHADEPERDRALPRGGGPGGGPGGGAGAGGVRAGAVVSPRVDQGR